MLHFDPKQYDFLSPFFDKYSHIYYKGNLNLLLKRKISIVGSRRTSPYTRQFTSSIAQGLNKRDITVVSGCAMGVDALAHNACQNFNTIGVVANGLDIRYPATNKKLIQNIEEKGLMLSFFEAGHKARSYNFVQRNELVVALSEALIITQANLNSGTLTSAKFAIKHNKPIYVLPHRLSESLGTQKLLYEGKAKAIYDLDLFLNQFGKIEDNEEDELLQFCKNYPSYEEAFNQFGSLLFEYELLGKIRIQNGHVVLE